MKHGLKAGAVCALVAGGMALASTVFVAPAYAGPASDALSVCLINSTTAEDHTLLVDWIFVVIARHPSVARMTSISDPERVEINRKMGALYSRLLTDACATQVKAAYAEDGSEAIESAFKTLGATAMEDLMSNPDVESATAEVGPYIDTKKLQAILDATPAKK